MYQILSVTHMGKSPLKIDLYCPLVMQGFSYFLGLFQVIMANPVLCIPEWLESLRYAGGHVSFHQKGEFQSEWAISIKLLIYIFARG